MLSRSALNVLDTALRKYRAGRTDLIPIGGIAQLKPAQYLGQSRRSDPQGSRLFRHRGPLSQNGFVNMAAEQVANLCFGLSLKATGQQYHHTNRACPAIDRYPNAISVATDLYDTKSDHQAEKTPHGTQQVDTLLKARTRSPSASAIMIAKIRPADRSRKRY
jgi:hypothetical protein